MDTETRIIYLYRITNQINGKIYIGQSVNTKKRWQAHKNQAKAIGTGKTYSNQAISRAIAKYGSENFIFEVIACCKGQDNANNIETELGKQYNSETPTGYNVRT
jgi:group I intron endonuclease